MTEDMTGLVTDFTPGSGEKVKESKPVRNIFKGNQKELEVDSVPEPVAAPFNFDEYLLTLNLRELRDLNADVQRTITQFEERKRKEALAALEAVARDNGFTLGELVSGGFPSYTKTKISGRTPITPKYRDPGNQANTWSGRGRKPLWFEASLREGRTESDMLI